MTWPAPMPWRRQGSKRGRRRTSYPPSHPRISLPSSTSAASPCATTTATTDSTSRERLQVTGAGATSRSNNSNPSNYRASDIRAVKDSFSGCNKAICGAAPRTRKEKMPSEGDFPLNSFNYEARFPVQSEQVEGIGGYGRSISEKDGGVTISGNWQLFNFTSSQENEENF